MKLWDVLHSKYSDNNSNKKNKILEYIGEDEDQMEIYFYKKHWIKTSLTYISIVLTACLLKVIFYWRPHWVLYFTQKRCEPIDANSVLLIDKYDQIFVETVYCLKTHTNNYVIPKRNCLFENTSYLRFFDNKKIRYFWNNETLKFERLYGLDRNILCSDLLDQKGLTDEEQNQRSYLFGKNEIEIKVQSYMEVLFYDVLSPFYVFQTFAIVLWGLEEYYYYGAFILLMSIASLLSSAFQTRRNQKQLSETVSGEDIVEVCKRGANYETQQTSRLVPGDVIVMPKNGCEMHCDVIVLNGSVIVDESLLTGESVPVVKSALPYSTAEFNQKHHFKHIIYSGTKVIQTRYYSGEVVKALVIRTSFQTAKGELVRSILFPKPIDFKFNRHIIQFIVIMVCIAMSGFIYTIVIKVKRGDNFGSILIKALDLITIVVPPELPAALTIANIFVDKRLRLNQIYCMSPRSINMAGCVDCICFDKTGTLTEDELSLAEVLPNNVETTQFQRPTISIDSLELSPLLICLASCHSLTILDNKIIGDPLDIKMFESTKWSIEEPKVEDINKFDLLAPTIVKPPYVRGPTEEPQVGIVRQFPFSSNLSRMSVITRQLNANQFELFVKGAPEVIATLCDPNTIPKNFEQMLAKYTAKSYRVLSLAYRCLNKMSYTSVQRAQREELETDLIFLGLVIMKNNLKDKTIETIDDLHSANIRTLMATGDNLMTALSVAQDCHLIGETDSIILIDSYTDRQGMPKLECNYWPTVSQSKQLTKQIDFNNSLSLSMEKRSHLALTGHTFGVIQKHFPNLLPKLVVCATVWARMSPENKQQLIELLQQFGYIVSMTGDGANDVGALKASNCGISLSDTEASVAAPFTSKTPNISCVTVLLREGRASLVSVFGVIRYMCLYNLSAFLSVLILYWFRSNLTDIQNLYQDLCVVSVYVILFGRTEPYRKLHPIPPPTSLISLTQLSSIISHIILVLVFQVIALQLLWQQNWYKEHVPKDELDYQCHDNYAIFSVEVFQFIILAIVFSRGRPYRQPFYTNILFLIALIVTTIITLYCVIGPENPKGWVAKAFEIETKGFKYEFRLILLALCVCHFILAFILEEFIIGKLIAEKLIGLAKETKYKKIAKQCVDEDWICDTNCKS